MNAVFVDTSYLLALELANDQNHRVAMQHWRAVVLSLPPLIITSYLFDEVVTCFNLRIPCGLQIIRLYVIGVLSIERKWECRVLSKNEMFEA